MIDNETSTERRIGLPEHAIRTPCGRVFFKKTAVYGHWTDCDVCGKEADR